MFSNIAEKRLAQIVAVGTGFTTIFLLTSSVTDPVNVTKFVSLGITATIAFGILVGLGLRQIIKQSMVLWIFVLIFLVSALVSLVFSASPISQGIYGSFGRNNGFLTYLFLSLLILVAASFNSLLSHEYLVKALLIAGFINISYCMWVLVFGDFIPWSNPYGNILGTFGNPNFIGAFLGIFISAYIAFGISDKSSKIFKISLVFVIPTTFYEIVKSHAIQGRVVALAGLAVVLFFLVRSKFKWHLTALFSVISGLVALIAMFGALQIGPLTSAIYKTSVSLRGQYWLAGWNTGKSHPLTGVGMDSFGDWYRRSRDLHALELPGVNVVVNASHNVPIDMFAFGGWPLFVSYLGIMLLGGWSIIKVASRTKKYDPIFVSLTASWFGYQLQSIISINQIGLAVWGWVLTGALISYSRISGYKPQEQTRGGKRTIQINQALQAKSMIFAAATGLMGLFIALPPLTADTQLRNARVARTVDALEATLKPTYFNPPNSQKYLLNIQNLEESSQYDLAHRYALEAVKWNPECFDLWKILYFIQKSTPNEKALALRNMKRLDPLNPDLTKP